MKREVLKLLLFSLKEENGKIVVEFNGERFEFDNYDDAGEFIEGHR